MADEESEAETIPGALDESVPVSSTQLARRSLWKRTESGGTGTGNGARGHGSRRYQRLQPHMKTATAQTIDVPAECSRSHSTGLAQQIRYIPVEDPQGRSLIHDVQLLHDGPHFRAGPCPPATHEEWRVPSWTKGADAVDLLWGARTVWTSSLDSGLPRTISEGHGRAISAVRAKAKRGK